MASFSAGTTFTDGVANDVTAAKLGALVNNATPTSGLIQDRTAETITATNDTLLIGDASDSNNLKRITVANFAQTLPTAKVTTGTISTATLGTTTGTAATFTTLTAGTTTSTAATITSGTIPTLTAGTTTGTAASFSGDLTIADKIIHSGDTNTTIRFPAADTVTVETSGTEQLRVDSVGRLLVGQTASRGTSPSLLQVDNSRIAITHSTSGIIGLLTPLSSTTNSIALEADPENAAALSQIQFRTDGTARAVILSTGNFGIGETSPDSILHVTASSPSITLQASTTTATAIGNKNNRLLLLADSATANNGGEIVFAATDTGIDRWGAISGAIQANDATGCTGDILFATKTNKADATLSERMRIDSVGNVGIGVTSPSAKLHVSGNGIYSAGSAAAAGIDFAGDGNLAGTASLFVGQLSTGLSVLLERGASPIAFYTNGTERARIESDGDVSIGTSTALSKLHVHGNITLSNTTTATSAGTSTITPPATVAGYLTVSINGTSRKIPYYAT